MTNKEAIATLEESKRQNKIMIDNPSTFWASHQMAEGVKNAKRRIEAFEIALSALRPVSREQVEKAWTAEWTVDEFGHKCSKCGEYLPDGEDVRKPQFCPECGRAMTDEAVQMVMERLEALRENIHNDRTGYFGFA